MLVVIRLRLFRFLHRRFHREQRFFRRVTHFHQRRRVARLLDRFGNHERDILAGIMHAVVAQRKTLFVPDPTAAAPFLLRSFLKLRHVQVRQYRQDTRHRLRCFRIDRGDFSFCDIALDRPAVRAFRHLELDRVFRRTSYLQPAIHPAPRRSYCRRAHTPIPATVVNARTMLRFASSILKELWS